MQLAKAQFAVLDKDNKKAGPVVLEVNFNPKELALENTIAYAPKQNTQQEATPQDFKGTSNFSLSMTLYFDTFEQGVSVRSKYMTKLESLTKPKKVDDAGNETGDGAGTGTGSGSGTTGSSDTEKTKPPPSVLFLWGKFRFCGVIEQLSQKYTMFLADGTPVRAEATIRMRQTMLSKDDNDLGETDHSPTEPNKYANDLKASGAKALEGVGPGADFDDPQEIINNAAKLDQANVAAAAQQQKQGGLSSFVNSGGLKNTLEQVAAGGVSGYLTGGSKGLKSGVFEGALTGAGDNNLFKSVTGGSTLGAAADTLASGKQLNIATIGAGALSEKTGGIIGGGAGLAVQRDGKNLNLGLSGGGGVGIGNTTIAGFETNQTRSTSGAHSSTTHSGIGVGSPGRPGQPNTLPTINTTSGSGSSSGSGSGSGDSSGSTSGSGSGAGGTSGGGGNSGGGAGGGRGGGTTGGGTTGGGTTGGGTTGGGTTGGGTTGGGTTGSGNTGGGNTGGGSGRGRGG